MALSFIIKMKIYKPKTIEEAIDGLVQFLKADLYSKFKPEEIIDGQRWCRRDTFEEEKELWEYLDQHFKILKKQIKELSITKKEISNNPRDKWGRTYSYEKGKDAIKRLKEKNT